MTERSSDGPHEPHAARLILVPNALDLGTAWSEDPLALRWALPEQAIQCAARLSHWVCENAKVTRAFLKRVNALTPLAQALQALDIQEIPRPRKGQDARPALAMTDLRPLLAPLQAGHDLGLISDAGLPGVADPGQALVAAAHELGHPVQVLAGPSSLTLALAASGLEGQHFAFVGYVPSESSARVQKLKQLEQSSRTARQTQVLIETPYRNTALMSALIQTLAPTTRVSVSVGLSLPTGWTRCQSVAAWRRAAPELPSDVPAVFALFAA